MAKLVCQSGPSAGHEYPIEKDKILFGRQRTCDIQILDSMASREHFLVRRDGKLFTVVDLESRNGTLLNGRKITERQLEFGDKIRIGQVEYLFVKEDGDLEIQDLLTRKYQVLEKIGEGGMGIVYKAIQRSMDREVALKILSPKFASRQRFVEQFTREARAAGALNHANIIQVHDVGSENGIHYFSMEFVDGVTCMEMLKTEGPLPMAATVEIIRQTAKALEYAHQHHIIHRDIKPDNIMVGTNNTVKLADLGISKTFEEAEAEGNPKRVIGTPHYMAPEAALGKPIDHRVDIYSLGATFYHLLSGRTPYSGTTATDILKGHIKERLTPICDINPDITPRVGDLINQMMIKNPDERIQTATAVIEVIQEIQGQALSQGTVAPGHDTMILQRLSRSSREALSSDNDTRKKPRSGGTRDRVDDEPDKSEDEEEYTDRVTGEDIRSTDDGADIRMVRRIIIGVIVLIAVILLFQVFSMLMDVSNDTATTDSTTSTDSTATTQTKQIPDEPNITTTTTGNTETDIRRQLVDLSGRINTAASEDEIRTIMTELDRLAAAPPPSLVTEIRSKQERAQEKIAQLKKTRQMNRFSQLRDQERALREQSQFLEAVKLLTDARGEFDGNFLEQLDQRIASTQAAYDERKHEVAQQTKRLLVSRKLDDLKALLAELPQPLADGEIGQGVKDAIATVEKDHNAIEQDAFKEMVGLARAWNFPEFDIVHENRSALVTTTALQVQVTELRAVVDALKEFPDGLAAGLKSFGGEARFKGEISGLTDPMMVGAVPGGLVLQMAGDAKLTVPWKDIPLETITLVCHQLLGGKGQAAIDQVVKLQGFSAD